MGKLGYSSITLTDLTDTLPVSLVLESNLSKNIQMKSGNLYQPDFTEGDGVIITPSLYLGQEDLFIETNPFYVKPTYNGEERNSGFIYYEIGNTKYFYSPNPDPNIYVDEEGKLHIDKNLEENITIEAYIEDFYLTEHNTHIELVQATNPINILFLEEGSNKYYAVIECEGGREHFEERNAADITMYATLYKGNEILNYKVVNEEKISEEGFSYSWEKLSDGNTDSDGSDFFYTVRRIDIINREHYTCVITDNETGLTYQATKIIQDFTDTYDCNIEYDKMPIFTSKKNEITLTAETYYRTTLLDEDEDFNLFYEWVALGRLNGIEVPLKTSNPGEKDNKLTIDSSLLDKNLQKQDFIVYCKVYNRDSENNDSQIAGDTIDIKYSEVYSTKITPSTIFVPTSSGGNYRGVEGKKYTFNFQLLDEDGFSLSYDANSKFPSGESSIDETAIEFSQLESSKWKFEGTLILDTNSEDSLWKSDDSSRYYTFEYTYLGQVFSEEILVVKQIQGKDGEQGFSGYSIDLSNEFHAFPGGDSHADPGASTEFEISAHYGTELLPITRVYFDSIIEENIIFKKEEEENPSKTNTNNITIKATKGSNDNTVKVVLTTGSTRENYTTEIKPISFYITVEEPNGNSLNFLKIFSYTITYNGKSYYLNLSSNDIIYKANGDYSPSFIEINAAYTETNGSIHSYTEGKIIYSLDNEKTWKHLPENKRITGYSNLDRIKIRLYSKIATFENTTNLTDEVLEENSSYLLDMETIPVLTSMEGYEFGGENLIKWSKTLPIGTNKWYESNNTNVISALDGEFTTRVWSAGSASSLTSPKISYDEEYAGKTFCLSFYIKRDGLLDSTASGRAHYINIYLATTQAGSDYTIGNIYAVSSKNFIIEEGIGYQRAYALFNFPSSITDDFYIRFGCRVDTQGTFSLKKPKLELGNIPSAWSSSPYDIDFSSIEGVNLIDPSLDTLTFSPENEVTLLAEGLSPGDYVFSWRSISISPSTAEPFLYGVSQGNTENILFKQILTVVDQETAADIELFLHVKVNSSFDVYFNKSKASVIIDRFKLEKGTIPTSYTLSKEDAESLINKFSSMMTENNKTLFSYTDTNGDIVYTSTQELMNSIGSQITIDDVRGEIKNETSGLVATVDGMQKVTGKIEISTEDALDPYIRISTAQAGKLNYLELTDDSLEFYSEGNLTASIKNSVLEITEARISTSLTIGNIRFLPPTEGQSGTALIWVDSES